MSLFFNLWACRNCSNFVTFRKQFPNLLEIFSQVLVTISSLNIHFLWSRNSRKFCSVKFSNSFELILFGFFQNKKLPNKSSQIVYNFLFFLWMNHRIWGEFNDVKPWSRCLVVILKWNEIEWTVLWVLVVFTNQRNAISSTRGLYSVAFLQL